MNIRLHFFPASRLSDNRLKGGKFRDGCLGRSAPAAAMLAELLMGEQMAEVNIIIRTSDQTRKAEVGLSGSQTGAEVIEAAVDNWSLPEDADYALVNARTAKPIQLSESLDSQGIREGDVLEVRAASDTPPQKPSMRWTDKSQSVPRAPTVDRVIVVCPNCKASLRLPAKRSGPVSCPFCSTSISAAI
jgi:hypothetical protein